MIKVVVVVSLALSLAAACDPTVPCTAEEAAQGHCALPGEGGSTGPTGPAGSTGPTGPASGVGFQAYGTIPNGAHVSLDCERWSVPGFAAHDCLYSHLRDPETVKCTLKLADRLGVVIGVATPASFMAEAGAISPVVTSPAYPGTPETLGHADGYLEVFGGPLPPDVTPMPGELSLVHDFGCGTRTANPRDAYVTVIAWVRGEEGFVDVNPNGRYDEGEPFVDQGEPFVDANDNGQWDPGEWFLDVNGDGSYTGPNGTWDGDTTIWSQTRVVYTGLPAFATDASGLQLLTRIHDPGGNRPPLPTAPATPFSVRAGPPPTTQAYGVYFVDALLNPLDPTTNYSVHPVALNVTATMSTPALPLRRPPDLFRLLYCDRPQFPANCLDGPAASGCRTSPCYVVPEVGRCLTDNCSGFQYGDYATLVVKGANPGPDTVWVSAEVVGFTTSFSISGQCLP